MRQLPILALGVLFLALPGSLDAQSTPVTLDGRVVNRAGDRPVPGAVLTLTGSGERVFSDRMGNFAFEPTRIVEDTLVISHQDFPPLRVPLGSLERDWHVQLSLLPSTVRPESSDVVQKALR